MSIDVRDFSDRPLMFTSTGSTTKLWLHLYAIAWVQMGAVGKPFRVPLRCESGSSDRTLLVNRFLELPSCNPLNIGDRPIQLRIMGDRIFID